MAFAKSPRRASTCVSTRLTVRIAKKNSCKTSAEGIYKGSEVLLLCFGFVLEVQDSGLQNGLPQNSPLLALKPEGFRTIFGGAGTGDVALAFMAAGGPVPDLILSPS